MGCKPDVDYVYIDEVIPRSSITWLKVWDGQNGFHMMAIRNKSKLDVKKGDLILVIDGEPVKIIQD